MLSLFITIYTVILVLLVYYKKFLFALILLAIGVLGLICFEFYKKIRKQKIKELVQSGEKKHFIDVNKEDWYILEEIPHLTKINAKKAVFIRTKTGKYKSPEDFILKVGFEEEEIKQVLDVIKV